jgi:hypothetical protein
VQQRRSTLLRQLAALEVQLAEQQEEEDEMDEAAAATVAAAGRSNRGTRAGRATAATGVIVAAAAAPSARHVNQQALARRPLHPIQPGAKRGRNGNSAAGLPAARAKRTSKVPAWLADKNMTTLGGSDEEPQEDSDYKQEDDAQED